MMPPATRTERDLLEPLLTWLKTRRRLRKGSLFVPELAWNGRRVDLATLTRSGRTTAYEMKLSGTGRALEQAWYNRLAFDRSYVVLGSRPKAESLSLASELGVGIIVIVDEQVSCVLESPLRKPTRTVRSRAQRAVTNRGRVVNV